MVTKKLFKAKSIGIFLAALMLPWSVAHAAPLIDTLSVQGFMKQANNSPITDGSYQMAFGVFQNGTVIWAGQYSVTTTGGLFSQTLAGAGTNLSALPAGTGMNANFSAVTLNPALLVAGGSGEIMVRVYAVSAINGFNSQFDINLGAVPTAMVADTAKQVPAGAITLNMINAAAKINVSAGAADAGKLPMLNASGLLDTSFIPALPASQIGSGQVGVANGGTGSSTGSITGTGNVTYQSAAGNTTTVGNNTSTSVLVLQSGTGGISQSVSGTTGNIGFTAGSLTGNIALTPGTTSGTVSIGSNTSSGNTSLGNAGGASVTTIQSGTGNILLSPAGAGLVRVSNGNGINLVHGTGSITLNAPLNPTSYNMNLPPTIGTANQFLTTNGAGNSSWSSVNLTTSVSGTLPLANGGTNNTSLPVIAGGVVYTDGTKLMNVGAGTTGQILFSNGAAAPAWGAVNLGSLGAAALGANTDISSLGYAGLLGIGGAGTTGVTVAPASGNANILLSAGGTGNVQITKPSGLELINGTGNIQVQSPVNPTSWTMILPSSSGAANQVLMTNGFGTTSWNSVNLSSSVTGTLPIFSGGTNNGSLAVTAGGMIYADGAKLMNVGAGTTGQILISNGAAAPSWSTLNLAALGAAASGANADISSLGFAGAMSIVPGGNLTLNPTGSLSLGGAATTDVSIAPTSGNAGITLTPSGTGMVAVGGGAGLQLNDTATHNVVIAPASTVAANYTITLPSSAGASGSFLKTTDGTGTTTWGSVSASDMPAANLAASGNGGVTGTLPIANGGTGAITAGAARTALGAAASGMNADISGLAYAGLVAVGGASSTGVTVAPASGNANILLSAGGTGNVQVTNASGLELINGSGNIQIQSPVNPTSWTMILPSTSGAANQMLMTDGSGTTSWTSVSLSSSVSGTLSVANGGTGATSASAALTSLGAAASGANSDITSLTGLTTALPIAEGGTNNGSLAVTAGGIVYSDGSKLMNVGAGTSGQVLLSNAAAAPSWSTINLASLGAAARGANTDISSLGYAGALAIGGAGTTGVTVAPASGNANILLTAGGTGNVQITKASGLELINGSGNIQIQSPLNPTSWTMILPSTSGVGNQVLMTDGLGTTSWTSVSLASSVSGTLAIANGGTGQTTQQAAMNALAGAQSSSMYLRSDGTNTALAAIQVADVPTLNQNTTGTAANVTGVVAVAHGGTGLSSTTANQILYSSAASTIAGLATGNNGVLATNSSGVPAITSAPTLGVNGTSTGQLILSNGNASGTGVTIQNNGATTAYNFNLPTAPGGAGQVLTSQAGGTNAMTWTTLTTGTVTAVSVAGANGFAGSSSGGATPSLTISTSVNGLIKGNGTALSAATSGTDYSAGTSALATGILKSTTGTGALTIAVAGDFPALNQNTTGTAANVTGTVALANGGTGSTTAAGARTNLVAAASGANGDITSLTGITTAIPISEGGTGQTTAAAAFNALSPVTTLGDLIYGSAASTSSRLAGNITATKQFLTQTGTGAVSASPAWGALAAGDIPAVTLSSGGNGGVTGTLPVANGGTGSTTAAGARTNLVAAASGANTDITGLNPAGTLSLGGASSTTVALGGTAATALNVGTAATGTETSTLGSTAVASATIIQAGTGKIKIQSNGATGVAFAAVGTCAVASFAGLIGANAEACAGLPINSIVTCSPTANPGTKVWSAWASAAGTVTINASGATNNVAWVCSWLLP